MAELAPIILSVDCSEIDAAQAKATALLETLEKCRDCAAACSIKLDPKEVVFALRANDYRAVHTQ